jgi:Topoisomerase IA
MKRLIIVESPSKAKTIQKYLGAGYTVRASGGHVCDLPQRTLGIDEKNRFQPQYEINPEKRDTIKQLKVELKKNDEVFLATDPTAKAKQSVGILKTVWSYPMAKIASCSTNQQEGGNCGDGSS